MLARPVNVSLWLPLAELGPGQKLPFLADTQLTPDSIEPLL